MAFISIGVFLLGLTASAAVNTGPQAPISFGVALTTPAQLYTSALAPSPAAPGINCANVITQSPLVSASNHALCEAGTYGPLAYTSRCVTGMTAPVVITSQKQFDSYAKSIADHTVARWNINIEGAIISGKIFEGVSDQNDCIQLTSGGQFFGSIDLQGGNDTVQLVPSTGGSAVIHGHVSLGDGADILLLGDGTSSANTLNYVGVFGGVDMGDGPDFVYGHGNNVKFQGAVETGSGPDTVRFQTGVSAHSVSTSDENDLVSICNALVESINTGSDADEVVIGGLFTAVNSVNTESGHDTVYMHPNYNGDITGAGHTPVANRLLYTAAIADYPSAARVSLGSGDDCFFGVHGSVSQINLGEGANLLGINDFYTGPLSSGGGADQFYIFSSVIDGDINMEDGLDYLRMNVVAGLSQDAAPNSDIKVNGDIRMGAHVNTAIVDLDTSSARKIRVNGRWSVSNRVLGNVCKIAVNSPNPTLFIRDGTEGCNVNTEGFTL